MCWEHIPNIYLIISEGTPRMVKLVERTIGDYCKQSLEKEFWNKMAQLNTKLFNILQYNEIGIHTHISFLNFFFPSH